MLEARSLGDLTQVTKKKKAHNAIRLHFERFAVQPPGAGAAAIAGTAKEQQQQQQQQQQQHVRGLSGSLVSSVSGQGEQEGLQYDVVELFTTDYMRVVEELKRFVTAAAATEAEAGQAAGGEQPSR